MIDVIIPAFNAQKTIRETLESIVKQTIKEKLKIYIVDDASENEYIEIVDEFKDRLDIGLFRLENNSGPGVARQYAIDNSNSEYIVFIDADDVFLTDESLDILYRNMEGTDNDIVISSFYEELEDNKFNKYTANYLWLHGKIYKRSFIDKYNIRFANFRECEDIGFNKLFCMYNPNIKEIDEFTYIWRFNKDSITRRNNREFSFASIFGYVDNIMYALNEGIKNGCNNKNIARISYLTILDLYYKYLIFSEKDKILEKGKDLYKVFIEYNPKWMDDEEDLFGKVTREYIEKTLNPNVIHPQISFESFLLKICNV